MRGDVLTIRVQFMDQGRQQFVIDRFAVKLSALSKSAALVEGVDVVVAAP